MFNLTLIGASVASVALAPLGSPRKSLTIHNTSDQHLYVRPGAAPTATVYMTRIAPGYTYDVPAALAKCDFYGLWGGANPIGGAIVTEGYAE